MKHKDDMKLIENYYQCPKEEYYDKTLHGKPINRKRIKICRKSSEDPLLKSSNAQLPQKVEEEDAVTYLGEKNYEIKSQNIKKLDAITKFGLFFIRSSFNNSTFIAHNR